MGLNVEIGVNCCKDLEPMVLVEVCFDVMEGPE